jgi:hypothetical protein
MSLRWMLLDCSQRNINATYDIGELFWFSELVWTFQLNISS